MSKEYYQENRGKLLQYRSSYYQTHKEDYRLLCANCNHKEYLRQRSLGNSYHAVRSRERRKLLRAKFFALIGDSCSQCDCMELDVLTVNHTQTNGAEHRRHISRGVGGTAFYYEILKTRNIAGLNCLCFSCNDNDYYNLQRTK